MAMTVALSAANASASAQSNDEPQQTRKMFSLENTVGGGREMRNYYPYSLSSWSTREGDDIVYYTPDYHLVVSHPDGAVDTLSSYSSLQSLAGGGYVAILEALSSSRLWITDGANLYLVNPKTGEKLRTVSVQHDDLAIAPQSDYVAYTSGSDLYVATPDGNKRVNPQTKEEGVLYGSTVHRNEFGIGGGMFWSPDGRRLCFYRKDESMVSLYPLVDVNTRVGSVLNTRYPMAGETSEQVSIGIYDVKTAKTVYLKTASPVDRYFTNISWSPDGSKIAVAEVNRDQDHMWFNIYNSKTGKLIKTLFEEADAHWVEPCEPAKWVDDDRFVWASYRDGYRHLYLYDSKGLVKQLTSGDWCVTAIYGYDNANKRLVIQTNREGYLFRDVCSLSLNGDLLRLSPDSTVSSAAYADGKSRLVINSSSAAVAKESSLCSTLGQQTTVVSRIVDPYYEFDKPEIKLVDLTTADGLHPLTGRLILPTNFDPAKKYPVVVYVYGGPHSQLVDASWLNAASPWMLYFAQEGYIVFTMDNRGTEFRGSAFEQSVHRQLGVHEMEDQMVGVNYLKSLPYVDQSRIGVHGWSFGGFMTISLLTTYPDVFKAGAAGGPVCDWKYYEVMYGERYMDTPQQNPDGYAATSLLNKIGDLKARLLVIHGAMDSTVVWQHSQQLLNSAIEKGIYVDYSVYPNHPHNVSGHDRTHLMGYIKRYFDDWLK